MSYDPLDFHRLEDEVRALRAENKRLREEARWIPTAERLPERGETVTVVRRGSCGCTSVVSANYWEADDYRPGHWEDTTGRDIDVTFWRPLPAPPDVPK